MSPETLVDRERDGEVAGDEAQSSPSPRSGRLGPRAAALVVVAAVAVGGLMAYRSWSDQPVDVRDGTELVDANGLAAHHGITVTLVAVTGNGGFIDFRYQVVDPVKASPLIHDEELLPILINEDTGATVQVSSGAHSHADELELGGIYYQLLANANTALEPGAHVTLVLGDVRIEHLLVQG